MYVIVHAKENIRWLLLKTWRTMHAERATRAPLGPRITQTQMALCASTRKHLLDHEFKVRRRHLETKFYDFLKLPKIIPDAF